MTDVLSGIGKAVGSLFGVEPKPVDETLEDQINKKLAEEREKIRPSREDIDWYSWITKDNSPVHRLKERAQKLGFDDTPLMGAHMAAYGEQFIEGVVEGMRDYWGAEIKIIGQDNKFKAPLYPGERVLWQVTGYKSRNGIIKLDVEGTSKGNKIIEVTSFLGIENPLMPQIAGPIFSDNYLLDEARHEAFYNCVGGKEIEGKVPNMLHASYVPATLLTMLERRTQSGEGANLGMKFEFLNEAKPGTFQVDIFPPKRKVKRFPRNEKDEGGKIIKELDEETGETVPKPFLDERGEKVYDYMYQFRAVVSQETKPITYGEVLSIIPKEVKF